MTQTTIHPIIAVQGALIAALRNDAELGLLLGAEAIFDAPPKGARPPYIVIMRHDTRPRDGDETPGLDHRVLLHLWHGEASRRQVLALATRIEAVVLTTDLSGQERIVTLAQVMQLETGIDRATGQARAAMTLRLFSEPAS